MSRSKDPAGKMSDDIKRWSMQTTVAPQGSNLECEYLTQKYDSTANCAAYRHLYHWAILRAFTKVRKALLAKYAEETGRCHVSRPFPKPGRNALLLLSSFFPLLFPLNVNLDRF